MSEIAGGPLSAVGYRLSADSCPLTSAPMTQKANPVTLTSYGQVPLGLEGSGAFRRPGSIVRVLRTERWVRPTERAGSEGSFPAACGGRKTIQPPCGRGNAFPLWWLAPPPFPRKRGHYKAPLCCELLMKGLLFRALLSHRSAGGRWCRKAPKGGKATGGG